MDARLIRVVSLGLVVSACAHPPAPRADFSANRARLTLIAQTLEDLASVAENKTTPMFEALALESKSTAHAIVDGRVVLASPGKRLRPRMTSRSGR